MRLPLLASAAILLVSSLAARADILYTVTDTTGNFPGTYTLTVPSFITTTGAYEFKYTDLKSYTNSNIFALYINFVQSWCPGSYGTIAGYCIDVAGGQNTYPYTLISNDFSETGKTLTSYGTYNDFNGGLTITIAPSGTTPVVAQTPEPSSIALLATGVLGVCGIMRRRVTE